MKHTSFPSVPLVTYHNPYLENPFDGCGFAGYSFDVDLQAFRVLPFQEEGRKRSMCVYENFLTLLSSCHSCAFWAHPQTREAADAC